MKSLRRVHCCLFDAYCRKWVLPTGGCVVTVGKWTHTFSFPKWMVHRDLP